MDEDHLRDLFSGLGEISIRRMFGGQGIYHQATIIAVVVDGELMLKADGETAPRFEEAGCRPWDYARTDGTTGRMPYWSVPGEALDDPAELTPWARLAWEAGLRASAAKANKARKKGGKR